MNPKRLILAGQKENKIIETDDYLDVSEFYFDTIQGENFIGYPAAFLRLQGCNLNCIFCDSKEVWRDGNPYTFDELIRLINSSDLDNKLAFGQHLVLTGGSPLKQQEKLERFIIKFISHFGFKPFIEIENECTIMPSQRMIDFTNCWNNSPKLSNSGIQYPSRIKPVVLKKLSSLQNSWFKFVVDGEEDIEEIFDLFNRDLIKREQIILMPCASNREELEKNREMVVEMAIKYSVRYSTREHIILWDKKTGI